MKSSEFSNMIALKHTMSHLVLRSNAARYGAIGESGSAETGGSIGAQRFPQIRPAPARPPAGSVPTDRRRHRSHLLLRDDGVRFVGMCVEQGTDGALDPSWPPAHTATTTAPSSWSRARAGGARMRTPGLVPSMSLANLSLPYECAGDHIDI
jgi:hypothetical protein